MEFKEYYQNNEVVEDYDKIRFIGIKARVFRNLEREFVKKLMNNTNGYILEAGVGTGHITEVLMNYGKVDGFDISKEMISKTKSKFPKINIKQDDILNLKLKKRYDRIVSIRVISHFEFNDAKTALENLKNVTKDHGYIIFNLENKSYIRILARKIINWGSTKTYQYSKKDVEKLLKISGLNKVDELFLDHLFILPLHIINRITFNYLEEFIINLELKLSNIRFMSNNIFIKCQK